MDISNIERRATVVSFGSIGSRWRRTIPSVSRNTPGNRLSSARPDRLGREPSDRRRVGEYAIFARKDRGSADWYVGGVNDAVARSVTLSFDFLDPGKRYTATIYKDGDGATNETEARHRIAYETRTVAKVDTIRLWLTTGGGAAMRLEPPK